MMRIWDSLTETCSLDVNELAALLGLSTITGADSLRVTQTGSAITVEVHRGGVQRPGPPR